MKTILWDTGDGYQKFKMKMTVERLLQKQLCSKIAMGSSSHITASMLGARMEFMTLRCQCPTVQPRGSHVKVLRPFLSTLGMIHWMFNELCVQGTVLGWMSEIYSCCWNRERDHKDSKGLHKNKDEEGPGPDRQGITFPEPVREHRRGIWAGLKDRHLIFPVEKTRRHIQGKNKAEESLKVNETAP